MYRQSLIVSLISGVAVALVPNALIGNYTQPNVGIAVPGILTPGLFNGTKVNLLPYFDGTLQAANRGGDSGVAVNSLDDGGAAPLKLNKPCNGNANSRQCKLINRLYEFFGTLLGCSLINTPGFPAYDGFTSMYRVHKFMDLGPNEFGYFVTQVGLAAASFGAAADDLTTVGMALSTLFGYRCAQPLAVMPGASPELQSICINGDCPLAPNSTCQSYTPVKPPTYVNGTTICPSGATNKTTGPRPTGTMVTGGAGSLSTSFALEILLTVMVAFLV